jgi:hypothetical protein
MVLENSREYHSESESESESYAAGVEWFSFTGCSMAVIPRNGEEELWLCFMMTRGWIST